MTLAILPATAVEPMRINDHDLHIALEWGIHNLSSILDSDNEGIPFFTSYVLGRPNMGFHPQFSVGNVTGRSLYALLKAEAVSQIPLDPAVVNTYRDILLRSYETVRGLPCDPERPGAPFNRCYIFNAGAGFRGLLGLVTFRADETARRYFEESIENWNLHFVGKNFSWRAFQEQFGLEGGGYGEGHWPGPGDRMGVQRPFSLWAFVEFFKATGYRPALELATRLGLEIVFSGFPTDGSLRGYDHGFEVVAEMNALAALALVLREETGDQAQRRAEWIMGLVRARYDNAVNTLMSQTGWFPETISRQSDVGEANNTAELIETAIKFGDWGWPEYYQDAERFARAHLLPSQLLDTDFIVENPTPRSDGERNVKARIKGAFGFPAPYGMVPTHNPYFVGAYFLDIAAGGVATAAEVMANSSRFIDGKHVVNLLFDHETQYLRFEGPYPDRYALRITLKQPGSLDVRLSDWVDRSKLEVSVGGVGIPFESTNHYLRIEAPPVGEEISIRFPLKEYRTSEVLNGRTIDYLWRGDSIIAVSQMGSTFPFFPEIDAGE